MDQTLPAWVDRDRAACGWQGVGNAGALGLPGCLGAKPRGKISISCRLSPARCPTRQPDTQNGRKHGPQPSPQSPQVLSPKARKWSLPVTSHQSSVSPAGSAGFFCALPALQAGLPVLFPDYPSSTAPS